MRLDDKDEIDNSATLPIRPPPRLPKRNKPSNSEEVFASLSTVRREEMYGNLDGFDQEADTSEMEHFHNSSDSDSDSDALEESKQNGEKTLHRNSADDISNDQVVEDDEDRCTSLPNLPTVKQESDTSEDSDFVSASFWLRNRRPDLQANNPPDVPRRIDSVTNVPKPKPRNCVSMNMDYMKPKSPPRPASPTLDLLGEAPAFPQRDGDEAGILIVDNRPDLMQADKVVVLNNGDWHSVKSNSDTVVKKPVTNSCDNSDVEDDGLYETLMEKPKRPPKLPEAYKVVNGTSQDSIYEATWQCSSARRSNSDDDDVCCSKGSEKLLVAVPDKTKVKEECNGNVEMRHSGNDTHKKGGVLSKLFSRKSTKEKELPERLVVSIPVGGPQRCSDGSLCGDFNEQSDPPVQENLYSDFPTPGDEPHPTNLDSDILKLSLLENGPMPSNDKSPIELPKRNFAQHPVQSSNVDNSTKPKQNLSVSMHDPIQGFNQDAYEPIDLSKSVNSDYQGRRPPLPSPPAKSKLKQFGEIDSFSEETPIAPPRRNRKTDKLRGNSNSPESPHTNAGIVVSSVSPGSPPIPKKRQSVKEALSKSAKEPVLPPRSYHDNKPAVPPPPRRPTAVLRASSDASGEYNYLQS